MHAMQIRKWHQPEQVLEPSLCPCVMETPDEELIDLLSCHRSAPCQFLLGLVGTVAGST